MKILYECNRKKPCNKLASCGKQCTSTADVGYAKNFELITADIYVEKSTGLKKAEDRNNGV